MAADERPASEDGVADAAWVDVLLSMDATYADLLRHKEALEARNAELEAMRAFAASVIASMTDVLIVTGADGAVVDVNPAYVALTGMPKDAVLGLEAAALFAPEDRAAIARDLAEAQANGRPVARALAGRDGPAPLELNVTPRLDPRRRPLGAVLTGRPLGELRRAYDALRDSHDALQSAQGRLVQSEKLASLGRLVAGVAHELNNPLSFVYGNVHALARYAAKLAEYFARVEAGAAREELAALRTELRLDRALRQMRSAVAGAREGAERARDIVESLRRLSADGVGAAERFDLAEVAERATRWVLKARGTDADVTLDLRRRVLALGRPGHVQQVVTNLVQNALDAMEGAAAPAVDLFLRREGARAVLEVGDRGPGVPAEIAGRIFDPFFTTKPVGQGTGLGLSISLKIAQENGGDLTCADRPGGGALFRLTLPAGDDG